MITFARPINPHGHLRQDNLARHLAKFASHYYDAYLAMPNTQPGILTGAEAVSYRNMLSESCGGKMQIIPTIKIREDTTPKMIREATSLGVHFGKVYPLGRTTHADDGVNKYTNLWSVFEAMEEFGMTALFHPTHPSKTFGNRDAEYAFIGIFGMIREKFPCLRMTWEHLSDHRCIPHLIAMHQSHQNVFVTITAHHMFGNEDLHFGDVSAVCQPPIRTEEDRTGLNRFVMENHSWVMGGLDDAPHPIEKKHVIGCCACGAFTTEAGTLLYATALSRLDLFDDAGGISIFERFVSINAANYFGIPVPTEKVSIEEETWTIPKEYRFGDTVVIPYGAGLHLPFSYVK